MDLPVISSCEGCGVCCMEQESPPGYIGYLAGTFGDDGTDDYARVMALPQELKDELLTYIDRLIADGKHPNRGICLWFNEETRQCKHHDLRPDICRDFEMGSEDCHNWRVSYGIEPRIQPKESMGMSSRMLAAMTATAMLGSTLGLAIPHGMIREGRPSRTNPPKSISRDEREKRKAKKRLATSSKKRNRK